jgi:hypothetical protein
VANAALLGRTSLGVGRDRHPNAFRVLASRLRPLRLAVRAGNKFSVIVFPGDSSRVLARAEP